MMIIKNKACVSSFWTCRSNGMGSRLQTLPSEAAKDLLIVEVTILIIIIIIIVVVIVIVVVVTVVVIIAPHMRVQTLPV